MHASTTHVLLWGVVLLLDGGSLVAQVAPNTDTPLPSATNPSIFAPLTLLPAPSAFRLATGAPGPKYWQNHTEYDIQATLDTATHTVRGSMTLRYTNHSPDTLKVFWFQTEQPTEIIDQFSQLVQGKLVALAREHPGDDVYELEVTPAVPLAPGQTTTFQVQWHFQVPTGGSRTLRDGALYEITQWYPRPNVYDDVKGWNTESYATNAEFYLEYGDFRIAVTVPAGYIVAATGVLENPTAVLTAAERARLAQAVTTDTIVRIITAEELKSGAARPTREGMLTWKFHAQNVRDAVWAGSPDYQWDATRWQHALVQAYYRPAASFWEGGEAVDQARMSLQEYSERWFPYPYPQVSAVEGPMIGMEYPMLAMDYAQNPFAGSGFAVPGAGGEGVEGKPGVYDILTHEVGHQWFPMLVGSNERVHPWMDEQFNSFINSFSLARRYPQGGDQSSRIPLEALTGAGEPPGINAGTLQILRRAVLGPAVFDKAFRTYIQRWAYKHPTPVDFFRTMADVSGHNLDWFWREYYVEAARFDQAIDSVTQTVQGGETHVTVTYGNKGRAVFPLLVRFTFSDGTTQEVTYPADVWRANPAIYTVAYTFAKKTVRRIVLDPDSYLPDADRANNVWTAS